MRLRRRRRTRPVDLRGPVRSDRRTKDLIRRLNAGDIALIDHRDIDRVAADTLIAAGVAAVVNASPSISGRYPNGGPIRIVQAGIPLLDAVGPEIMDQVREGEVLELHDGALWRDNEKLAVGEILVPDEIEAAHGGGAAHDRHRAPDVRPQHARVHRYRSADHLRAACSSRRSVRRSRAGTRSSSCGDTTTSTISRRCAPYVREYKPVLIAVDGGADALLDMKLHPDMIIGDFDSLTERAMHCGAQLIHHVHPDGRAPGRENLLAAGVEYDEFVAEGMSEDAALLIAYEAGATLIVAVGTHATMVEFLDKGRRGMASTFLTRLRLGPVLVDAKGVSRLYEGRIRRRDMVFLVASAVAAMVAMTYASHSLHVFLDGFRLMFSDTWARITNWF